MQKEKWKNLNLREMHQCVHIHRALDMDTLECTTILSYSNFVTVIGQTEIFEVRTMQTRSKRM